MFLEYLEGILSIYHNKHTVHVVPRAGSLASCIEVGACFVFYPHDHYFLPSPWKSAIVLFIMFHSMPGSSARMFVPHLLIEYFQTRDIFS